MNYSSQDKSMKSSSPAPQPLSSFPPTNVDSRPTTPVKAEQLADAFSKLESPTTPGQSAVTTSLAPITPPMITKPRLQFVIAKPHLRPVARRLIPLAETISARQKEIGPNKIRPYLWLGDGKFAQDHNWLTDNAIDIIINATSAGEVPCAFPQTYHYVRLPILDQSSTQLSPYWPQVHNMLQAAKQTNKRVLLHCQQGISRSAALVIAHLMQEESLTLSQAFEQVRFKRPYIEPNPGFLQQLRQLEQQLFGEVTSTKALTFLDTGWHFPDGDVTNHLQTKLEQLLGHAAAHQPLPAQLLPDLLQEMSLLPLAKQRQFIVSSLHKMLSNYGKLDSSCQQAHQALFTWLAQIGTKLNHGPQLLQQGLKELFDEDDWGAFLLDVPLASTIVASWPDKLRAAGALSVDMNQNQDKFDMFSIIKHGVSVAPEPMQIQKVVSEVPNPPWIPKNGTIDSNLKQNKRAS